MDDSGAISGGSPKKKMPERKNSSYEVNVKTYTPPRLSQGKSWFIAFNSYDPVSSEMKRKRIYLNGIKSKRMRKDYADELIKRLNAELKCGWNPWIENKSEKSYHTLDEVADAYRRDIAKKLEEGYIREKTAKGYASMLKNLLTFNKERPRPITYIYQFNLEFCNGFIDHIWLDRGSSGTTRDNYLVWLRSFSSYLHSKQYIQADPTVSIKSLGKKKGKKQRTVISSDDMKLLKEYCENNNKHYLLACYIIYYCFIRPREMSYIKLDHISIKRGTIFIPDYSSKNKKDGIVTLPDKVLKLMLELDIFKYPSSYFLFGKNFTPSESRHSDKQLRDFWSYHVRRDLNFPKTYKFYSLKDTGITDLIRSNKDLLSVRDQARHYSLVMTDIYTPKDIMDANELIKCHSSNF
ncbi:MAG: site-specific integrase [Bacteroidales bacterium]|nr:site-specific integrase [Bacteroidales bacterium]